MTVNSPDSLPEDDPQEGAASAQGKGDGGVPGQEDGVRILLGLKGVGFSVRTDSDAILLAGNAAVALSLGTGCAFLRIVFRQ